MPSLSYCRFRNTLHELRHCAAHFLDPLPKEEHKARAELLALMQDLADYREEDLPEEEEEEEEEEWPNQDA